MGMGTTDSHLNRRRCKQAQKSASKVVDGRIRTGERDVTLWLSIAGPARKKLPAIREYGAATLERPYPEGREV